LRVLRQGRGARRKPIPDLTRGTLASGAFQRKPIGGARIPMDGVPYSPP
jgi:hypothetical protein